MQIISGTKRELATPYKTAIYDEFILWSAMPPDQRKSLGIEDQGQFIDYYKIGKNTPGDWKKRADFWPRVTELRKEWAMDKTSDVIYGIYRAAIKGNDRSQKLWLQYFLDFSEKTEVTEKTKVEIGVNDIRWLIDGLPEPLRSKHYANLRELLVDAEQVRNAGLLEDGNRPDGLEETISGEADHDAQDLPVAEAHEVAVGNSRSVRCDMGGSAGTVEMDAHNHKGAARWW